VSATLAHPPAAAVAPRRPGLDHATASRLAATEYERLVAQLRALAPDDWRRPTACPAWDVHAMCCHILGMAELAASPLEQMRQLRAAKRRGGLFIDALTGLQVDKHVHRSPAEVVELLARVTPRAARGRRRTPGLIRGRRMANQAVDEKGAQTETWTVGYLTDVILTRDTFIHRSDIALATGRDMVLTPDHDGVLVADVAADWASRHGQPCTLVLTGPAGGEWSFAGGGARRQLDAVDLCRTLSGRAPGEGLLVTRVPF
jgi:uncharacterized protein (TIGR03083 family)